MSMLHINELIICYQILWYTYISYKRKTLYIIQIDIGYFDRGCFQFCKIIRTIRSFERTYPTKLSSFNSIWNNHYIPHLSICFRYNSLTSSHNPPQLKLVNSQKGKQKHFNPFIKISIPNECRKVEIMQLEDQLKVLTE